LRNDRLKLESARKLVSIGENPQLVADDPVEFEKILFEAGDCKQITYDRERTSS
jgi:hypothetical protein